MASDDADERRQLQRRVNDAYGAYHDAVDASRSGRFVRFMNFGFDELATGHDEHPTRATVDLPTRLPNRNAARLVAEVIGDEALDNRVVLDVGCGRGGCLWLVRTYWRPRFAFGVDLAFGAASATRTVAPAAQATAEALPCADQSIDVVLNIESSLHYPIVEQFYHEVARVLRPGGAFLYTDLFHVAAGPANVEALNRSGLALELDVDITDNVLASRSARAERESLAFDPASGASPADVARFVGVDGTEFHRALAERRWIYRLLRLRRTDVPITALGEPDPRLSEAAREADRVLGRFARVRTSS